MRKRTKAAISQLVMNTMEQTRAPMNMPKGRILTESSILTYRDEMMDPTATPKPQQR